MRRSRLGAFYRRYYLYPRIGRRLSGAALDVGCGIGDMLAFRPNMIGVDINERSVGYCKSRGLDARVMIEGALPFDANSFDSVLLDNVLEHIPEPESLLAEVRRVLRDGGTFVVGVPGSRGWDTDPDHKVRYDERLLLERVATAGFVGREVFHTPLWRSKLLDRKLKQYCIYGVFSKGRSIS